MSVYQTGYVVCNDTYLNPIQQAHYWYTQSTNNTIVHVQHVLAENIDSQKHYFSIKLPNTCNFRENI